MDDNVIDYQTELLARLRKFWRAPTPDKLSGHVPHRIAGSPYDQPIPDGTANPYWQIIRHMPLAEHPGYIRHQSPQVSDIVLAEDGIQIFGDRHELCFYYTFSICSPDDVRWIAEVLDGRPVVEAGAGGGYWAWQAQQRGIDWIAYDPYKPGKGHPAARCAWATIRLGDAQAVSIHPDRVLFMSWPSPDDRGGEWAAEALAAYQGDTLIYAADPTVCANQSFYNMLEEDWQEIEIAPGHVSWWMVNDFLSVYQRKGSGDGHRSRHAYALAT